MKNMKKIWLPVLLLIVCVICACGGSASYKEKPVKVICEDAGDGELTLRFYNKTPNVPYLGMNEYSTYVKRQPLTLRVEEDGTYALVNPIGEEILCDPKEDRIVVRDWGRFFDLPLPLEDEALGWKDTRTHFVRITNVEYEGTAELVTLDLAKYGIDIYADEKDIYLPVSLLSNIMTDIATNHLLYNGEDLYLLRIDIDGSGIDGFFESERLQAEINGAKRKPDIIKQAYADLCFTFDHLYGHPGVAVLDSAIAEKGLDQALKELGEEGQTIRQGLLSENYEEYASALEELFERFLSDGHTVFGMSDLLNFLLTQPDNGLLDRLIDKLFEEVLKSPNNMKSMLYTTIVTQREIAWGEDTYREAGSTAIIRLDDFNPDEKAWDDYYRNGGDLPEDALGIVVSGLEKASQNPDIKNVIFDLSCNEGGSPDVMMAIFAMTTGQDQMYGLQNLTGQKLTFTFETDTNFDGVFDEKDKEKCYDFNYGALVTRHAFSCGNLFPILFQENGAVLIGEPSSGGSCCVQIGTDAEGFRYYMSSAQWQVTDSKWNPVEGGCRIDLPTTVLSSEEADYLLYMLGLDKNLPFFPDLFDAEKLDDMMNEWFKEEAQVEAA